MKTKLSIILVSLLLATSTAHAGKGKLIRIIVGHFTKKNLEKYAVTLSIGASIFPVLAKAGLFPKEDFPVEKEIEKARKNGAVDYRTTVCRDEDGHLVPLTENVVRCPYGESTNLYYGPTIKIEY